MTYGSPFDSVVGVVGVTHRSLCGTDVGNEGVTETWQGGPVLVSRIGPMAVTGTRSAAEATVIEPGQVDLGAMVGRG